MWERTRERNGSLALGVTDTAGNRTRRPEGRRLEIYADIQARSGEMAILRYQEEGMDAVLYSIDGEAQSLYRFNPIHLIEVRMVVSSQTKQ